jgi:hypothetical protein
MKNSLLAACLVLCAASARAAAVRVAVVIDDFALTYKANPPDEDWMTFDQPLTFAVMPDYKITTETAQRAEAAGKEVTRPPTWPRPQSSWSACSSRFPAPSASTTTAPTRPRRTAR